MREEPMQGNNSSKTDENHPTNGFFYGYVVLAACFAIQVVGWGIHNSYGIFFSPLIREFGWSRASVAGAASISFLLYGIGSIINGGMNDRIGPRHIMTACGLLMGAGYMLMSGLDSLWEIYLFYGLVVGMGVSGTDVVLLSTVARWFHAKRGMMSGIIKVGTGVGMVIAPLFISFLLKTFPWRTTFFILGAIILISYVLLAQLLVRDPALKELHPDNVTPLEATDQRHYEQGLTFREALASRQFWSLCVISLLAVLCTYTVMMHIVPHATDMGIPPVKAAGVLSTLGGVSILGRLIMGATADRTGAKKALMISFALLFVALCFLPWAKALWMLYLFAVIQGFAHGAYYALVSPAVAEFFGTRAHGAILGAVIFSTTLGGAVGPFAAGYLFDATHTYRFVFLMLAVASLVTFTLTATFTPLIRRQ